METLRKTKKVTLSGFGGKEYIAVKGLSVGQRLKLQQHMLSLPKSEDDNGNSVIKINGNDDAEIFCAYQAYIYDSICENLIDWSFKDDDRDGAQGERWSREKIMKELKDNSDVISEGEQVEILNFFLGEKEKKEQPKQNKQ